MAKQPLVKKKKKREKKKKEKKIKKKIKKKYINTIFLDGDQIRDIYDNDLGYSYQDRLKNAIRLHRTCKFLIDQNINVVCATISLFKKIHQLNRKNIKNYFEIFIECDIKELIKRDQKKLYSNALSNKLKNIVGLNQRYDKPENSDLIIDNSIKNNLKIKVLKIIKKIGMKI